eukprot:scaffold160821_cov17-Tisochrysis_lutea.AAC.1
MQESSKDISHNGQLLRQGGCKRLSKMEAGWVQEVVEKYQNGGVYGRIAESVLHKWAAVKAG